MCMKIEIETRIGGIPSIVEGFVYPEEGDNWNDPYLPDRAEIKKVMNMKGKLCKWRESRMTGSDEVAIEHELIDEYRRGCNEI